MRVSRIVQLRPRLGLRQTLISGFIGLWFGCSSSSADSPTGALAPPRGNDQGVGNAHGLGGSPNLGAASGGSAGSVPVLPPEEEKESAFKLPVLSGRWVWSANPESGHVAVIDTKSLSVRLANAGYAPTYLAPLVVESGTLSAAVVLNEKSADASVMRLTESELRVSTVPTHSGANAWAVSPSGRWAIAWSDVGAVKSPDPADSFQDLTVIDTRAEPVVATRLSAGFRPSRIFFRDDEERAFVVSSAGITLVELRDEPFVSEDVPLTARADETPVDVAVTPAGTHALFRVEGSSKVSLVELSSGRRTDIALSGPVTDLDLVADGGSAVAVVRGQPIVTGAGGGDAGGAAGASGAAGSGGENGGVENGGSENGGAAGEGAAGGAIGLGGQVGIGGEDAGAGAEAGGVSSAGAGGMGGAQTPKPSKPPASGYGPSQVAVFSIGDALADAERYTSVFLDDLVGSVAVSSDGSNAVLYTTATDLDRITVLPTDAGQESFLKPRATRVRAPVDAVFMSPDARYALVALRATMGSSIGGAFGVVPLDNPALVKIQPTDAAITGVAFAPSPTTSAILTADKGQTAYLVHFPALRVDPVALPSLPLAAGIVPEENVGYVVQKHPDGRLSLINLDSGEPRTLTGFELSGGLSDGQQ